MIRKGIYFSIYLYAELQNTHIYVLKILGTCILHMPSHVAVSIAIAMLYPSAFTLSPQRGVIALRTLVQPLASP
jgi:TctA family transporter